MSSTLAMAKGFVPVDAVTIGLFQASGLPAVARPGGPDRWQLAVHRDSRNSAVEEIVIRSENRPILGEPGMQSAAEVAVASFAAELQAGALQGDGLSEMALYILVERDGRWWLAAGQNTPITDRWHDHTSRGPQKLGGRVGAAAAARSSWSTGRVAPVTVRS